MRIGFEHIATVLTKMSGIKSQSLNPDVLLSKQSGRASTRFYSQTSYIKLNIIHVLFLMDPEILICTPFILNGLVASIRGTAAMFLRTFPNIRRKLLAEDIVAIAAEYTFNGFGDNSSAPQNQICVDGCSSKVRKYPTHIPWRYSLTSLQKAQSIFLRA